jgi:hypothetical protein
MPGKGGARLLGHLLGLVGVDRFAGLGPRRDQSVDPAADPPMAAGLNPRRVPTVLEKQHVLAAGPMWQRPEMRPTPACDALYTACVYKNDNTPV